MVAAFNWGARNIGQSRNKLSASMQGHCRKCQSLRFVAGYRIHECQRILRFGTHYTARDDALVLGLMLDADLTDLPKLYDNFLPYLVKTPEEPFLSFSLKFHDSISLQPGFNMINLSAGRCIPVVSPSSTASSHMNLPGMWLL